MNPENININANTHNIKQIFVQFSKISFIAIKLQIKLIIDKLHEIIIILVLYLIVIMYEIKVKYSKCIK